MIQHKRYIIFVLILVLMTSLSSIPVAAQEVGAESHKAIIQQVYAEAFNTGNFEIMDASYAAGYINHGFGSDLIFEDYKAAIGAMRAAMPDFQAAIEIIIAEEEWAATRLLYSGTFENEWIFDGKRLEPTGEQLVWTLNILYRFDENGQIAEEFTAFDRLVLPMPADAPLPAYVAAHLEDREHIPAIMEAPVTEAMEAVHKETFSNFIETALNKGDLTVLEHAMAAEHLTHEPFGDFTREEFGQIIVGFRAAVPDLYVEIDALVAEGDWVAARLIYTGTFTNPVSSGELTLEPTNTPIRFIINVFVRFNEDGAGIEDFKEYNRLGWLQQGGILPPPS